MSILMQPPNSPEIVAANDYLFALLEAARLAQIKLIAANLRLIGTAAQQEAFQLTWAEIRGVAARDLAKPDQKTRSEVNRLVDEKILKNPAYDKFRVGTAGTDDPLLR